MRLRYALAAAIVLPIGAAHADEAAATQPKETPACIPLDEAEADEHDHPPVGEYHRDCVDGFVENGQGLVYKPQAQEPTPER